MDVHIHDKYVLDICLKQLVTFNHLISTVQHKINNPYSLLSRNILRRESSLCMNDIMICGSGEY